MAVMSDSGVLAESGISAREAEVLAALGEHLTNAEIGAKLFISVRTVESHVSSLLRKLGATDRRELADLATRMVQDDRANVPPVLPSPLTSFIGREKERRELADALQEHRQVSAVGPGGVGKTRLALAVTADVADRFADGVWFVNLVPVTDPAMIGPAVAAALGIGERQGRSVEGAVAASLADGETLIVLDNCEHVVDGVAPFVERLLGDCPRLTVLATSRARLMVPFEWVFPVPPLSLPDDQGHSDAVALFEDALPRSAGPWTQPGTVTASSRSAAPSTASPWPSSSRSPGSRSSASTVCKPACPTTCGSCPGVPGPMTGTGRSGRCWIGAMPCSPTPTRCSCAGWRSSPRRSRPMPRSR
jgi:DNA-binding CsgD family transcriptional regulator